MLPMLEVSFPVLKNYTTMRIGGTASHGYILDNKEDIKFIPDLVSTYGKQLVVIGNGSNLLVEDGELQIVPLKIAIKTSPEIMDEHDGKVFVKVGAGTKLATFSGFALRHGLSGLEGLCGIPATVGGALAMNAGSRGCEICDLVEEITIATRKGFLRLKKSQIFPTYRKLSLPSAEPGWVIVEAIFGLTRRAKDGIFRDMNFNFLTKKSRQPVTSRTAGCVFKNPSPTVSAGKLLDMAGFRGKKYAGMAFSGLHANFLVNEGTGSARAAFELISQAQEKVWQIFGYKLELEVKIIPCRLS